MKNIFKQIAYFFGKQPFIIKVPLFALMVVPFFMLGVLLKWIFIENLGYDEFYTPNTFFYTLPPLVLFAIFLFVTFTDHER
jgi:hypothetical protein